MIGIRREDKNEWERRAPLTPDHVAELVRHGFAVRVEPSELRVFPDEAYRAAGASVDRRLDGCRVVLGVKEIPIDQLLPGMTYLFFAHVVKGQPGNMPLLRRLLELGCTLIDYERIVDARGKRIIFFGRHAGFAGMIDTLWALSRRLEHEGVANPFRGLKLAHEYANLEEAHLDLARVAEAIRHDGIPPALDPIVFGFTGSGNASRGAQEIFALLPAVEVAPAELPGLGSDPDRPRNVVYKAVFSRADRCSRIDGGPFDGAEFAAHPERYRNGLSRYLDHLTALVNGVYWTPGQPRVVGLDDVRRLWHGGTPPRLRVLGDVSCDLHGSIEATTRLTTPGDPVFVYEGEDRAPSGVAGNGPVILAIDNLPCQLPADASEHFGDALLRFLPVLARCDWSLPLDALPLGDEIRRAVVTHRGALTPDYAYLEAPLRRDGGGA